MAKRKKPTSEDLDQKSMAAGPDHDGINGTGPAYEDQATRQDDGAGVFDGPMDADQAIEELIKLNHERTACARRWEDARTEAADAKKELDNASNAISLLIDRIDRQMNGTTQPVLATLGGHAEATV